MKINEAEQRLGITKANIRFYEKEGLLNPSRNKSGYRDYTEADIARLKQIIILRKLGFPVQQIADILDGATPFQEAIGENIEMLNQQIDTLNGAIALCRQLQSEQSDTLDTDRYWSLIQQQENLGIQFNQVAEDYLSFTEANYDWFLWPLPGETLRKPWKVGIYFLAVSALLALISGNGSSEFFPAFLSHFFSLLRGLLVWTAIFIPIYFLSKRRPRLADRIMKGLFIAIPILALLSICILFYVAGSAFLT